MKNHHFFFLLLTALLTLPDCGFDDDGVFRDCESGDGPVVERVLSLPDFKGVDLQCSANVYITQGPDFEVVASGEANIIDLLETDVRNEVWDIEFDDCVKNYDLDIFITMPSIEYLAVSGSGEIRGENFFETGNITLRISGSGDLCLGLISENIDGRISGSGDMELEGEAENLDFRISGSGDLGAFPLIVQHADLQISGSGDASVHVLEFLKVRISGSGDVFYKGFPELDVDISGSGDLVDAN